MAQSRAPVKPPEPEQHPRVLLASAMDMHNVSSAPAAYRKDDTGWQAEAWGFFRDTGGLSYAATVTGSVMSKATLSCVQRSNDYVGTKPGSEVGRAALQQYFGGPVGQSQMLMKVGPYMVVPGEYYVVAQANPQAPDGYDWFCLDSTEVKVSQGRDPVWEMKDEARNWQELRPGKDIVIRHWWPDPEDRMKAYSPTKSLLPVLGRIRNLRWHLEAQLKSRLTGAGILLLPREMDLPPTPQGLRIPDGTPEATALSMMLAFLLTENVRNPGAAAAQAPIILQVDGQYIPQVRLMHFWSDLDGKAIDMLSQAYSELGMGMNMPIEILLGAGRASHWSAWAADESYIKSHIEPALSVVAAGIAKGYLRTIPNIDPKDTVAVDTTAMRVAPDRSANAIALNDRMLIADRAARREAGFGEEDAPKKDELKAMLLRQQAKGQTGPDTTVAALNALGADLPVPPPGANYEARPDTHVPDPQRVIPDPTQSEADGPNPFDRVVAAADICVKRALERAGNRMVTKYNKRPDFAELPAVERYKHTDLGQRHTDDLLAGTWDDMAEWLTEYGDTEKIVAGLDAYTRGLLCKREPHNPEALEMALLVHMQGMRAVTISV